ncbi:Glycerol-3-phosphate acyltransferase [Candidatus Providencia siddallii]|uniref:Glycerol-3-phosphate acyltransferase n=1 Tax=Candidatus Providencia siddallii TaxID=1715285 RepID=A0A0M6W9G0_9GAMM|nr:Glycerol-3-phosphate acyltransferase [Candidatus Providencia siddallii]
MSLYRIYFNCLSFLIKFLIKNKLIPINPIKELHIDLNKPMLYILPYSSISDLIILQKQCKKIGLPDPFIKNNINGTKLQSYIFIENKKYIFKHFLSNTWLDSINIFKIYLDLHKKNPNLNIQILPIFIIINRSPKIRKIYTNIILSNLLNSIKKLIEIIRLGRDSFIMFSPIVYFNRIIQHNDININFINKLIRISKIYYLRQKKAMIGPKPFSNYELFHKLLTSKIIKKVITDESRNKNISIKKAKQNAIDIIKEIAANFSYESIRWIDKFLGYIFKRFYKKINVNHIDRVHKLIQNGFKIVYIPSHRSHMDYLLLSYVLYNQGLVPPHIAAGNNLNFWPTGNIFRRLGAFFIRRTFKSNKFYSTIFREYLYELFIHGYSIEYFIEGGRSRTGYLLKPKTGILSMTLQTMIRNGLYQIAIVPIYIGYEYIIEVESYIKELYGNKKENKKIFSILNKFYKLQNLGQSHINFGKPIYLWQYLNNHIFDLHNHIKTSETHKPFWLNKIVNFIAIDIMININNSSTVNAINLFSTALLSTLHENSTTSIYLIEQVECYLKILRNVPYTLDTIIPNENAYQLFREVLKINKFGIQSYCITKKFIYNNAMLMTYYRNNICHLLALPSLIACIIFHYKLISRRNIYYQVKQIYPFLKAELFLHYTNETLNNAIDNFINELNSQKIIYFIDKDQIIINSQRIKLIRLLAAGIYEILQRYVVILFLLNKNPEINKNTLEKKSIALIKYISVLDNIKSRELFDKSIFFTFIDTLRENNYMNSQKKYFLTKKNKLYIILANLISTNIRLIIETFN